MSKALKELRQLNGKNRRSKGQLIFWHLAWGVCCPIIGNLIYFGYCKFTDNMSN